MKAESLFTHWCTEMCVSHSFTAPHLEYWASVRVSARRLGLCRASGRFFQRWLQRGKRSSPGWLSYHLKDTHMVQSSFYCISHTEKIVTGHICDMWWSNSALSISTGTFVNDILSLLLYPENIQRKHNFFLPVQLFVMLISGGMKTYIYRSVTFF